jgi:hypothetical protein
MFKTNSERLSRIKKLREQGHTIDQISAITGDPRSSVGYYVKKYCGGKAGIRKSISANARAWTIDPDSRMDQVDAYVEGIRIKERLSIEDIVAGKKRKIDVALQVTLLDMLERDPETLYFRMKIISEMIRLAPFLRIDLDDMRDMINLLLTENIKR